MPGKPRKKRSCTSGAPVAIKKLKLTSAEPVKSSSKDSIVIPVVDFDVYKLSDGNSNVTDEKLQDLCKDVRAAFTEVGFVYLRNTGIDQEEVARVMDVSRKFFLLPEEQKTPFKRGSYENVNHGWVSLETERLNPRRPGDLKEAFNITSLNKDIKWPSSGDVEGFQEIQMKFFMRCKSLSLRVLRVMALSLGLDSEFFLTAHRHIGSEKNGTTLRSLYYPPVKNRSVKKDQLRCGEHSDYGSITLVFQSHEAGLQVLSRKGEYISVPSIPGTVLVNIADLMQRWTSDVFVSAVHRVLLPPLGDSSTRQSMVFFVQPDDEALITCCDGSDKYPPVKSLDYLLDRFKNSYGTKQIIDN